MSEQHAYLEINGDQWETEVVKSDRPVIVDFFSDECPPCDALAPKFSGLAELWHRDVKFVKVFRQQNRPLAENLGVRGSPTVLCFKDGHETGQRLNGGIRRADLIRNLESLVTKERAEAIRASILPVYSSCDVLVIGAGPAGLTTGMYTAQAKLKTVIVDSALAGGNLSITHQVSNFPGFPKPVPGWQLADHMATHAKNAGCILREAVDVTTFDPDRKVIIIDGIETISARYVILATGNSPKPLGIPGEKELKGKGVSYCATCDGKYFEGKEVVVIGGGNSALEESLFLATYVKKLTIVHRRNQFRADQGIQEKVKGVTLIETLMSNQPTAFTRRDDGKMQVDLVNTETGAHSSLVTDGIFVFAGMVTNLPPGTEKLARDESGAVLGDEDRETNLPGIFVAGDVRAKRYRQITTAVSDGTEAAMAVTKRHYG
jgi:thioredoxin reductase (NADPH)